MTRVLSYAAFLTGIVLIALMARLVAADDRLTLGVMLLIVTAYGVGAAELSRYQRHTQGLRLALSALDAAASSSADSPTLDAWLARVPEPLRPAVHQRIVGHFQGLPAPILTPYLVGLLVMLGLMGTFVGMVATLGGAALALEGGTELTAIRQGLAAPIEGLGIAFGTSVAGVAASAMLGLIATLSQRERLQLSKVLDHHRDAYFRDHSLAHQRTKAYSALQQQANALPDAVASLGVLSQQLGQLAEQLAASSERSGEQLLGQQREFEAAVRTDLQALTTTLAAELKDNLAHTGKEAAETLRPFVGQLLEQASQQLASEAEARRRVDVELHSARHAQQTEELEARRVAQAQWQSTVSEHADTFVAQLSGELQAIQSLERQRLDDSGAQLTELQASLGEKLQTMTTSVNQSVSAMESAAGQSISIGSDLINTLQSNTDRSLERDKALMEERSTLLQQQVALLDSNEQHWKQLSSKLGAELDQLLARNGKALELLAVNLGSQLGESGQQVASTALELAALSGGFADSVASFKASSEAVNASLTTTTDVLIAAGSRSDEQMGYYVDQAREIIDHNLITQQTILERLESVTAALPAEADRG